jgi:hypothetical protein
MVELLEGKVIVGVPKDIDTRFIRHDKKLVHIDFKREEIELISEEIGIYKKVSKESVVKATSKKEGIWDIELKLPLSKRMVELNKFKPR